MSQSLRCTINVTVASVIFTHTNVRSKLEKVSGSKCIHASSDAYMCAFNCSIHGDCSQPPDQRLIGRYVPWLIISIIREHLVWAPSNAIVSCCCFYHCLQTPIGKCNDLLTALLVERPAGPIRSKI